MARKPTLAPDAQPLTVLPQAGGAYVIDATGALIPDPDETTPETPVEQAVEGPVNGSLEGN